MFNTTIFDHAYDPLTGFILTTAVVILVVGIQLWRGRKAERQSRARTRDADKNSAPDLLKRKR